MNDLNSRYCYFPETTDSFYKKLSACGSHGTKKFAFLKIENSLQPDILDPFRMGMILDGDPVRFPQKVQCFAKDARYFQTSYRHDRWKKLVSVVIDEQASSEQKEIAQLSLLALERFNPALIACNDNVAKFLDSPFQDERVQSHIELTRLVNLSFSKCEFKAPIKTHTFSKGMPNYGALTNPTPTQGNFTHSDFWTHRKIVMGHPTQGLFETYFRNLVDVAEIEALPKPTLESVEWLQDPMIVLPDGTPLTPSSVNLEFNEGIFALAWFGQKRRIDKLVENLLGAESPFLGQTTQAAEELRATTKCQEASFYFEGGNLISAINRDGEKVYLCGASNILVSILNSQRVFSNTEKRKRLIEKAHSLMNDPGDLQTQIAMVEARLDQAGLLVGFGPKDRKKIATLTVASIPVFKQDMEATLNTKVITLGEVFEHQPEVHLDLFMMPAPGGDIFIQDHFLSQQVINEVQETYGHKLSDDELDQLDEYARNAKLAHGQQEQALTHISKQLRSHGFNVIPVPGSYWRGAIPSINFLNSIVGIGERGKYCITNGASGQVGRYLADAFAAFLKKSHFDNIYFIGRETASVGCETAPCHRSFRVASASLANGGGIHCRTQVLPQSVEKLKLEKATQSIPRTDRFVGESLPVFFASVLQEL